MIDDGLIRFGSAIDCLSDTSSLMDLIRNFSELRNMYGIDHIVYHSLSIPGTKVLNPIVLVTYDNEWVRRYNSNEYFSIDPVVLNGKRGFLPIDWNSVKGTDAETAHFFQDAQRHDVGRNGVTLPIIGPHGERSLFTVTSNCSAEKWRLTRRSCIRDFQMISHFIHDRAIQLSGLGVTIPKRQLSPREIQCLQALALGTTPKQIAYELGISQTAVRLYLQSLKKKLGCLTLSHAVATASRVGIILV